MVMRFIARGMGKVDAELCVAKMAQYETFFVNLMVTEELGLRLPDNDDGKLLTDAFLMTISFGIFGSLPLAVYIFELFQYSFITELSMFYASGLVATVLMFILGSMKCFFSTVFWIYSGIETVALALVASGLAYVLGSIVIKMLTL